MSDTVITVEHLSKKYRLGQIGVDSLREAAEAWWHRLRGRDPAEHMGELTEHGAERMAHGKTGTATEGIEHQGREGSEGGEEGMLAAQRGTSLPLRASVQESVSDDEIWALKDVSCEVKRGEVLGIIGRNGAGKSTLLKILTRITEPTSGRAIMRGRVASLLEVGTGFHPELTGRENIYLNGAILGMKRREIAAKFDEIVAFAEIGKFIDTPVKRYSSGMYVRLAFAVAAHLEAEILLVDEVLAVGDMAFQAKCIGRMSSVAAHGKTVLLVSHNMSAILQLCPHTILISAGEARGPATTRDVVDLYCRNDEMALGSVMFENNMAKVATGTRLMSAHVENGQGQIRPDIQYADGFRIVVEYQVVHPIVGLRVGCRLHTEGGVAVLHTSTADIPVANSHVTRVGVRKASVDIPGAWLASGRYRVEVGLWSPAGGLHEHVIEAFSFLVVNATVESTGREVLRPLLCWIVE